MDSRQKLEYLSFELLIGNRLSAGYPVTVVESPAGEGEAHMALSPDDLQDAISALERRDADEGFLAELGTYLFEELFSGELTQLYRASLAIARQQGDPLRIRLRVSAPELAVVPWEYLYDPDEQIHLATNAETAFVRYIPVRIPARPTQVALPLRVLLVASNPHDMPALDVELEVSIVRKALELWIADGRLLLEVLERATVVDVNQALRRFDPHVFHFIGHGLFVDDTAFLVFQDDENRASLVDEHKIQELFSGCKSTRLAILNACQSAAASSARPLVGLAPRLLQRQVSGVVAMQHAIADEAAAVFAREFYQSLIQGYPIEAAVAEGRRGIFLELGAAYRDWGTPVLFLRAKDGRLFAIQEASPAVIAIPTPPPRPPLPATEGFVGRSAELDSFAARLDADHLAVIVGMAGIGKTALAAVLAGEYSSQERIFWYSFRGNEGVADLVWQLAGFLAGLGRGDLWQMLQTNRLTGGKPLPVDTLIAYVIALLQGTRCLLCLDDLHLVDDDPDFQRLFVQLRQVLRSHDFFLLVTSRQTPTGVATGEFEPLDGLTETDARRLLSSRAVQLSDSQFSRLYRHTAGNAVFLVLAMNALRQRAPDELLENLAATDDIGRYLSRQVDDGLTGEERSVLEAVSVMLGYPATRDALEETLNAGRIVRALRSLVEHHLLEERRRDRQTEYGVHAILREYYYDVQLSARDRRRLHQRAGVYYRDVDDPAEHDSLRAAIHFERAGEAGEAARLAVADVWGVANTGQIRTLADLLERFAPAGLAQEMWLEVNLARGQAWGLLGNTARARAAFTTVLDGLEENDGPDNRTTLFVRVCRGLGELLERTAPAEAETWLERGLEAAPPEDRPLRASLLVQLGTVRFYLQKLEGALAAHQEGLALLSGEPSHLRCTALRDLGAILFVGRNYDDAHAYTHQALEMARRLGDQVQQVAILSNLGVYKTATYDWTGAISALQEALALSQPLGLEKQQAMLEMNLGAAYAKSGDAEAAARHLQRSLELAERTANLRTAYLALFRLAELAITTGELEPAPEYLDRAERLACDALAIQNTPQILSLYRMRAEYFLAVGDMAQAETWGRRVVDLAQDPRSVMARGIGERLVAQALAGLGQTSQALAWLEASLESIGSLNPYETARAQVVLGTLLADEDPLRCRELLQTARSTFVQVGAVGDVQKLDAQFEHWHAEQMAGR